MDYAEKLWIAHIQSLHYSSLLESIKESKPYNLKAQLGVYIDEDGLLRCHGGLGNSDLDWISYIVNNIVLCCCLLHWRINL